MAKKFTRLEGEAWAQVGLSVCRTDRDHGNLLPDNLGHSKGRLWKQVLKSKQLFDELS